MRIQWAGLGLALLMAIPSLAIASPSFEVIPKQPPLSVSDSRIEVEAVFSYDCPLCFRIDPSIMQLQEKYKDDIEVIHVPAPLNPRWANYSRAYYVAKELDIVDRAHERLFHEVLVSDSLVDQRSLADYLHANFQVRASRTLSLYNSEQVRDELIRDYGRLREYNLSAVPAIVVDGQYVITGKSAGGVGNLVTVAEGLINDIAGKGAGAK